MSEQNYGLDGDTHHIQLDDQIVLIFHKNLLTVAETYPIATQAIDFQSIIEQLL